jgi:hypothetical protein
VFISEQVLYSKSDLERHMRTGDDEGPMAESGFKGHPLCRFCRCGRAGSSAGAFKGSGTAHSIAWLRLSMAQHIAGRIA